MKRPLSSVTVSLMALLGLAVLTATPARAGLTLCNRTSTVVYAATATAGNGSLTAKGWTRVVPGACTEALKEDLSGRTAYVTAKSARAYAGPARSWSGPVIACVKEQNFTLTAPASGRCPSGSYGQGFSAVDTHHMRNWTVTLREDPDFFSMEEAERAGLKRLVESLGGRNLDAKGRLEAALTGFKKRLHLAANAPASVLFDALETEALRVAAPAGYSLCNDSREQVWAAIGQKKGAVFLAKGWWTVEGGACAQLISEPLTGQKIWLRVERGKAKTLVGGADKFCVTDIAFEIQGRQNCKARGLNEAGFAQTNNKGASGYTAHVTANGLNTGASGAATRH